MRARNVLNPYALVEKTGIPAFHRKRRPGERGLRAARMALSFSVLMGCAWLSSEAATPEAPNNETVAKVVEDALPGFLSVHRLELSEPVDYGNAVEPVWRWRFEAAITPREALYTQVEKLGDVVLVERTVEPKTAQQSMYGTARATFETGRWEFELKLENRPFEKQGRPRSYFKARTAVAGSEEERELRDNAHQRFVQELEAKYAREREEAKGRHRNELAAAGEAQGQRLAELETEHETALAAWKMELAARAERRREEVAAELELAAINQDRMRRATASAEELGELAATTETTMAGLEAKLETLASQEAETLAATARVVEGRANALETLIGELDGAANAERYRIVLDTVSDLDSPWLVEAAIRHGLGAKDPTMERHAWLRLMDSGLIESPNGQILLAEHVEALKKDPILLSFVLGKAGPKLAERPTTLQMLTARLPSIEQWASTVESVTSSSTSDTRSKYALGAPNNTGCKLRSGQGWRHGGHDKRPAIRVRFEHPVLLPAVTVHQAGRAGLVKRLTVWGPGGEKTEYEVEDTMTGCRGASRFRLYQHPGAVVAVSVWVDSGTKGGIDAIALAGIPIDAPK